MPIGALVREAPCLRLEDSLVRAAEMLRESAFGTLFVYDDDAFSGFVTEQSLLAALADGANPLASVQHALVGDIAQLPVTTTGAEALRFFAETGSQEAVVVDGFGRPHGLISPSDLYPKVHSEPRPAMVGGMATPFGVYLTNGTLRAGAGDLALLATGALLFVLFVVSSLASQEVGKLATTYLPQLKWLHSGIANFLPMVLFLTGVRVIPLAGIHAAEHKVVHALERGEPLEPGVVARMSRVHPRCGTNLAAAAMLFLSILSIEWIPNQELRFLVAVLATMFLWRPLGSLLQLYVTTRPPNARQIEMGIRAGKELLAKFQSNRQVSANPLVRIWASGMLHVMAGSSLAFAALDGISRIFHFDIVL